jgi:flavin-dependent dehydrogenase
MKSFDVVIAGGGLAGLGLARQLQMSTPELSIAVIEKQQFPRPRAIAKVGESTVDIGSHYLIKHLELGEHLEQAHLKKFGIRMFFGEAASDFAQQDELGVSQTFGIPTYQIDRGDIENHLAEQLQAKGVTIIESAQVSELRINEPHSSSGTQKTIALNTANGAQTLSAKWVVDAAGRASLLKNHLGLAAQNAHKSNAIWFRVDRRIELDDWTANPAWQARCTPRNTRWLSTNHLMGPGYWVWVIPLASGVTSIGIVMDDIAFNASNITSQESAMRWLHKNQRRCAEAIGDAHFMDFVILKDYSYDCKQMFSDQGWALTGEAGMFADPFYSPGTDFIAFGNGFITELIRAQMRGEDIRFKALLSEKLFQSIYTNTLSLYQGQYGGFGDRVMMGLKLLWDYSYYWGVLSLLYFGDVLVNLDSIRSFTPALQTAKELNQQVQQLFRTRALQRLVLANRGVFLDQYQVPCLQHFNQVLMQLSAPNHGGLNIATQLQENMTIITQVAAAVTDMLSESPSTTISDSERDILGDYRMKVLG